MAALKPNFSHRLADMDENNPTTFGLYSAVEGLATQAVCSLDVFADQFTGGRDSKLSDDINYFAIQSIANTVNDIREIVHCFPHKPHGTGNRIK